MQHCGLSCAGVIAVTPRLAAASRSSVFAGISRPFCKPLHLLTPPRQRRAAGPLTRCHAAAAAAVEGAAAHSGDADSQSLSRQAASHPLKAAVRLLLWSAAAVVAAAALLAGPSWAAAAADASNHVTSRLLDFALHLDEHLGRIIAEQGARRAYALLAAIVFCETGLVVTPFLPGDSLLFAAGACAALGHLGLAPLLATFIAAATLGDAVNYALGQWLGRRALQSKAVNAAYVEKTQRFYAKHGSKTIVLARFVPIVRTFAPFVAGVGSMQYSTFATYNVGGAVLWAVLFVGAGYLFGNLPFVQHNFTAVVLAIVAVSVLPVVYEVWAARKEQGGKAAPPPAAEAQ